MAQTQTAVGALVQDYMDRRGFTQPMLAAKIDRSQAAISHLVRGTAGASRNFAVYLGQRKADEGTVCVAGRPGSAPEPISRAPEGRSGPDPIEEAQTLRDVMPVPAHPPVTCGFGRLPRPDVCRNVSPRVT
jgi:hypothetical protein